GGGLGDPAGMAPFASRREHAGEDQQRPEQDQQSADHHREQSRPGDALADVGHPRRVGDHDRADGDADDADDDVAAHRPGGGRGVAPALSASPASSIASLLAASSSAMSPWNSSAPAYFTPRTESAMN